MALNDEMFEAVCDTVLEIMVADTIIASDGTIEGWFHLGQLGSKVIKAHGGFPRSSGWLREVVDHLETQGLVDALEREGGSFECCLTATGYDWAITLLSDSESEIEEPVPQKTARRPGFTPAAASRVPEATRSAVSLAQRPMHPPPPVAAGVAPAQLVTSPAGVSQAVTFLLLQPEVALDCEGDLGRHGCIDLMQACAGGRTYIFDLQALRQAPRPGAQAAGAHWEASIGTGPGSALHTAMTHLKVLLEHPRVLKVMHDCRADAEALFYLHGIRLGPVWDTQVGTGLAAVVKQLGNTNAGTPPKRAGLNVMLQALDLPVNPHKAAVHGRMNREKRLWTARPLDQQLIDYASADVEQLLPAKSRLSARLGESGSAAVLSLSRAAAVLQLSPADQGLTTAEGSYAAAANIPVGVDLELTIDPQTYRPQFTIAGDGAAASSATAPPITPASEDPDLQLMLDLFPEAVGREILQLCASSTPSSRAHSADVQSLAESVAELSVMDIVRKWTSRSNSPTGSAAQKASPPAPAPAAPVSQAAAGEPASRSGRYPLEVVVDIGRPVTVRFSDGEEDLRSKLDVGEAVQLLAAAKQQGHLGDVHDKTIFHSDNRTGIPRTLHRISAMRSRKGEVLGLTYRIGRNLEGSSRLITDVLASLANPVTGERACGSLLLLGPPGVGKTTLLRDITRVLANDFRIGTQVLVVDSSNEIGGDADEAHPCIGRARRMQVPKKSEQHRVMTEALQNHTPKVLVIDEIGYKNEAEAAKKFSDVGVMMVGTAHGVDLEGLMKNPDLNGLIGGITQSTVGDIAAKKNKDNRKTKSERRGPPTFTCLIEVLDYECYRIHTRVADSVDQLLSNQPPTCQLRWVRPDGRLMARMEAGPKRETPLAGLQAGSWLGQLVALAELLSSGQVGSPNAAQAGGAAWR